MIGRAVFEVDTDGLLKEWPEHERDAMKDFLAAHGIPPKLFMVGTKVTVRRKEDDGTLWLNTWRAIPSEEGHMTRCEYCPACVRQEKVEVPLAGAVPILSTKTKAYYGPEITEDLLHRERSITSTVRHETALAIAAVLQLSPELVLKALDVPAADGEAPE
jgi:hypothetical protein